MGEGGGERALGRIDVGFAMRVPPLVCLCFIPGVFLSSRVTGACPVTADLVMRVNVRTTTTSYKG